MLILTLLLPYPFFLIRFLHLLTAIAALRQPLLMAKTLHDYKTPRVVASFLVHFDVKTGYKLVWSKTATNISLQGIEYKALPSGVHECDSSTVFFAHKHQNSALYGLSQFRSSVGSESDPLDRSKVKMYSLGIICEPQSTAWKPNQYISTGWEHIELLDSTLYTFLRNQDWENFLVFEELHLSLTGGNLTPHQLPLKTDHHLLSALPELLDVLGPLVFVLYKQCLLRKRVLLFHHSPTVVTNYSAGAFTYLLSLLSLISHDTPTLQSAVATMSQPIYNVGLHDLEEDDGLVGAPNTIAVTSDDILMYQDVYDVGVSLPADASSHVAVCRSRGQDTNFNDASAQLLATRQDLHKFRSAYRRFRKLKKRQLDGNLATNVSTEELSSINTATSTRSLKLNWHWMDPECEAAEPLWWLESATAPMSWREFVWLAFLWFASAGSVARDDAETVAPENDASRYQQLIELVSSFHRLTRKWFTMINDIVMQELDNSGVSYTDGQPLADKLAIEITYQDIYDMELDPYTHSDLEFLDELVKTYWGDIIDRVQIGTGLGGVLC